MFLLLPLSYRMFVGAMAVGFVILTVADIRARYLKSRRRQYDLNRFVGYFSRRGVEPDISAVAYQRFASSVFAPNPFDDLALIYGFNPQRAGQVFAEIAQRCAITLPIDWPRSSTLPIETLGDVVLGLWKDRHGRGNRSFARTFRRLRHASVTLRPFVQLQLFVSIAALFFLLEVNSEVQVNCIALSPDGKTVALGGGIHQADGDGEMDGLLWTWDLPGGTLKRRMELTGQNVDWLSFSPDGRQLACWQYGGPYRSLDAATGLELSRFTAPSAPAFPIGTAKRWLSYRQFLNWGSAFASISRLMKDTKRNILAVSPGGLLAACCPEGPGDCIEIWNILRKQLVQKTDVHAATPIQSIAFSSDDNLLAFPLRNDFGLSQYVVWSVRRRRKLLIFKSEYQSHHLLAFSGNGKYIATQGYHGPVEIWDVSTGKCLRRIDTD